MADRTLKIYKRSVHRWSKWGNSDNSSFTPEAKHRWVCQVCGRDQPAGFPQYLVPLDDTIEEYLKLCAVCRHKGMLYSLNTVVEYLKLLKP